MRHGESGSAYDAKDTPAPDAQQALSFPPERPVAVAVATLPSTNVQLRVMGSALFWSLMESATPRHQNAHRQMRAFVFSAIPLHGIVSRVVEY
jgi:hypothetical protein